MSNGIKQTVNRTFKSSVFVMLFSDAAEALKLYNAVNGTNYKNPQPSFAIFNVCGRFIFIYNQTEGLIFGKSGKTAAAKVPDFL